MVSGVWMCQLYLVGDAEHQSADPVFKHSDADNCAGIPPSAFWPTDFPGAP